MFERTFRNPEGLNEILSELLGYPVNGDWSKAFPSEEYVGKWKKEDTKKILKGRTGQVWGDTREKSACSYLATKLKESGWTLLNRHKIGDKEYDCVGWNNKPVKGVPDLVVETYFPKLKNEKHYELKNIRDKVAADVDKLEKINAKFKYIVIGVPRNRQIKVIEQPHPSIKVKYQKYRFTRWTAQRTNKYVRRHCSCPYCKNKPIVVIWERGGRIPNRTFFRHHLCPFCKQKVEIRVHEHLGRQAQYQREVTIRKPQTIENLGNEEGPQRSIDIFPYYSS